MLLVIKHQSYISIDSVTYNISKDEIMEKVVNFLHDDNVNSTIQHSHILLDSHYPILDAYHNIVGEILVTNHIEIEGEIT